jgi:putative transcriptional regulator
LAIIINLDVMLARRKRRLTDLSNAVGISIQNLSVLKTGKSLAIKLSTLNRICAYLQCQPGDILEYVPDPEGEISSAAE